MSDDDEIPVLREAVSRKARESLTPEQIDELCDMLNADTWVLLDKLIAEALRDVEDTLRYKINDRLNEELPALVEKVVREKLGSK